MSPLAPFAGGNADPDAVIEALTACLPASRRRSALSAPARAATASHTRRCSATFAARSVRDLDDRRAAGARARAPARRAARRRRRRARGARRRARRPREVEPVRRRDVRARSRVALARDGQEVEDPAAVVVDQHDRQVEPEPPRRQQRRRGRGRARRRRCSSTTGPSPAAAAPNAAATVPSIPFAPRLDRTRGASSRAGAERLDVADRHRGGDEQRRLGAAARAQLARDARLGQLVAERRRDRAGGAARRPRASAASQPRSPACAVARRERARAPRAGRRRRERSTTPRRVLPGALGVERDLRSAVERREPRAQRLGGRQVADAQHELGALRGGEAGVAQQRVVVGDRGRRRGARRTAGRRAAGSRAARGERARRPRRAPASRSSRPATITPCAGATARSSPRGSAAGARRAAARRPTAARRRAPAPGSSAGSGAVEHERLAQRRS